MQKKVIALAVAGLVSGAAFAQTNVTVYGIADAYYVYSNGDQVNFSGINPGGLSGSRLGFKGEEALGNGLKAVFTYEFGSIQIDQQLAAADGGNGMIGTRQSFVGLASDAMGTVSIGRQYAPSFLYLGATSANEITIVNPSNYFNPAFATLQTGGGSRWNNSVAWSSPVWSGFDVRAIYGFGEKNSLATATTPASDVQDAGRFGFGARYANGPFYATAIWQQIFEDDVTAAKEKNQAWALGANYDFKVVKVFGNYIQEKFFNGNATGSAAAHGLTLDQEAKKQYWSLGASVPVGTIGSVNAEYVDYRVKEATDVKAKGFGIGYNHFFSKRTTGYVNVSYIDNKDGAAFGGQGSTGNGSANFAGSNGAGSSAGLTNNVATFGESNTNFAVGMRHVF